MRVMVLSSNLCRSYLILSESCAPPYAAFRQGIVALFEVANFYIFPPATLRAQAGI
jgi:hypothetical protein